MRGLLVEGEGPTDEAKRALAASPKMEGLDLASVATCKGERAAGNPQGRHHVVAFDFGMKENILRMFASLDCRVTVVPARTPAARVHKLDPDGLFLSNGPGDPGAVNYIFPVIRELTKTGLLIRDSTGNSFMVFLVVSILYFVINYAISLAGGLLERKFSFAHN